MTESQGTRPTDSDARAWRAGQRGSPPGGARRAPPARPDPRPLNSAGRPVEPARTPGGESTRGEPRGREPTPGAQRPASGSGDFAEDTPSDWERIRRAAGPGGAGSRGGPPPPSGRAPDLSSLLVLLDAVRAMVPRELERQFTALLREVLLTLRALIDWYLERLDGGRAERRVEDIPIE